MKSNNEDSLIPLRHSTAHVLASALQELWPDIKFGIGPVVKDGFYYDVDLDNYNISETDFTKIESEMKKIIENNVKFEQYDLSVNQALDWAEKNKQPYKLELINDLKRDGTTSFKDLDKDQLGVFSNGPNKKDEVSFYRNGNFVDLCRGPHLISTKEIQSFKLLRVSGAYWRGNQKNTQMQRIYGTAFFTSQELDNYLNLQEEAKKRDHRQLGNELDLFLFSDLVGSGLPMFTPRGTVLRDELSRFSNELRLKKGFEKVFIPHITKKDLYEISGHWAKFSEELFLVKSQETDDELVLKPMNCPHHTRIYASRQRSYKDLPIKYLETTTVYRDEKTGELGGLNRVRSATQDDSHVFCRQNQIEQEIDILLDAAKQLYNTVDMKLRVRLSYRDDSNAYLGDMSLWQSSQQQLKNSVVASRLEYFEQDGEAAFYGPKIDFMVTDALNREHQVATIQLDFIQPERFKLEYINETGQKEQPVMIHCALLGSIERFMSVYIEHTAGKFPVWNAPEQIRLITVNQDDSVLSFAETISSKAFDMNLRIGLDNSSESISKKIRNAELMKVPYIIVIGKQELESNILKPRIRSDLMTDNIVDVAIETDDFLDNIKNENNTRATKTLFR